LALCVLVCWAAVLASAQAGGNNRQVRAAAGPAAGQVPAPIRSSTAADEASGPRELVDRYCVTCHNARLKTANLLLDELDLTRLGDHAEVAEKIIRKVRAGLMPPTGVRRPAQPELESLVTWMETEVDRASVEHLPAPGLHRLNRTEYANAVRDLLALEVDASTFLPTDDSTHGFDNIAGALTMSPALLEAYLSAAGKISRLALGHVTAPTQWVWDVPADTAQNHHIEGLPFGTRGGILIRHQFPAVGEYAFNIHGDKRDVHAQGMRFLCEDPCHTEEAGKKDRQRHGDAHAHRASIE
jgi:mono/diheme cytochrome c family protein